MPIFLDSHTGSELPVEVIRDFLRRARSATADGHGVLPLDLYCGDDNAPDEAAIRQAHAAQGVVCRRIRPVHGPAVAADQLTPQEESVVRQMIAAENEWGDLYGPDADSLLQVS
jgi:hypothetical protein